MSKIVTLSGLDRFKRRYEHESGWLPPVVAPSDIVLTYGGILAISTGLGEHPIVGSLVVSQSTLELYIYTGEESVDGMMTNDGWILYGPAIREEDVAGVDGIVPPELIGTKWMAIAKIGYIAHDLSNVEVVVRPNEIQAFNDMVLLNGINRPYIAEINTIESASHIVLSTSEAGRVIKSLSFR